MKKSDRKAIKCIQCEDRWANRVGQAEWDRGQGRFCSRRCKAIYFNEHGKDGFQAGRRPIDKEQG